MTKEEEEDDERRQKKQWEPAARMLLPVGTLSFFESRERERAKSKLLCGHAIRMKKK